MSVFEDLTQFPPDFCGAVRLFPLADLVLFPHVVQPLHIFEPCYRDLLADALAGDRLIAMVRERTDWPEDYSGHPPLESVACLGRIVAHAPEPDGRANILLAGLRRVAIRYELPSDKLFRQAKVDVLNDEYPRRGAELRPAVQRHLIQELNRALRDRASLQQQLAEILKSPIGLGALTDILAFSLPWETPFRQQLLEETNVDLRAALLLEELPNLGRESVIAGGESKDGFPPAFSQN